MSELTTWAHYGREFEWSMPFAPWWKRLPIIRHLRAIKARIAIEFWYSRGPGVIGLRSGYDDWVVFGIWHGLERAE